MEKYFEHKGNKFEVRDRDTREYKHFEVFANNELFPSPTFIINKSSLDSLMLSFSDEKFNKDKPISINLVSYIANCIVNATTLWIDTIQIDPELNDSNSEIECYEIKADIKKDSIEVFLNNHRFSNTNYTMSSTNLIDIDNKTAMKLSLECATSDIISQYDKWIKIYNKKHY